MTIDGRRVILARDAARRAAITPEQIAKLCRSGKLQGVKQTVGWLVDEECFEQYLARTRRASFATIDFDGRQFTHVRDAARVVDRVQYIVRLHREGKIGGVRGPEGLYVDLDAILELFTQTESKAVARASGLRKAGRLLWSVSQPFVKRARLLTRGYEPEMAKTRALDRTWPLSRYPRRELLSSETGGGLRL